MIAVSRIFLTGRPGAGKTTAILKTIEMLECETHGFYTREMREEGRRMGFSICDLEGNSALMAHVDFPRTVSVGKYGVDVEAINRIGVAALRRALEQRCLAVVDEVGKMELASFEFRRTIMDIVLSAIPMLGTMHSRKDKYTELIRQREDVEVWTLTRENRDELPLKLAQVFQSGAAPSRARRSRP